MNNIQVFDVRSLPSDSAFLLDDGKTAILYDSGFAFTGARVVENVKKVLGDRNLDYIFLTHSHYDHALGSVYALKHWPNARVVAGEYAAKIFAKDSAKAVMRDLDRKFADRCGVGDYEDLIDSLKVDITVSDGDVITAGDFEFEVLNLPGHTKCSVGFYCRKHQLLLSCETIGVYDGAGGVIPSYLVGYRMALDSIARVQSLNVSKILIPHYGLLEGSDTKRYLECAEISAVTTAETVASMIKAGKSDEEIFVWFENEYFNDYVKSIYPRDAMVLNTGITINLLRKEMFS